MDRAAPPPLATLVMLTALGVLSLTLFLPALPVMAVQFGVSYGTISLAVAGYLLVTACLQLVLGPLSDRFGRRPVLLAGMAVFTLASLGCALSGDIAVFLACRMAQGAGIAGAALAPAMVRDTADPGAAARRLGQIALVMAGVPLVGPMLGGLLQEVMGWRAVFVVLAVLGAALWLWCWRGLAETNLRPTAGLRAQIASYPALLGDSRFWGFALCSAFSVGGFYAFLAGAPLVAKAAFDLSPGAIGLAVGSITGGFGLGSYLSTRLALRVHLGQTVLGGRLLACGGLALGLLALAVFPAHPLILFAATACQGIANGITMPGSTSGALSVRPDLAGSAAGLAGALAMGTGAVITSGTGALIGAMPQPWVLLALMLALALAALLAAFLVRRGV